METLSARTGVGACPPSRLRSRRPTWLPGRHPISHALTLGSNSSQCGMACTLLKPPRAYSMPPAAATACPPRTLAMLPGSTSQLQAGDTRGD